MRPPPWPRNALLIGLGAGSLAKFIYHRLPQTRITAVEIDPQVERVARAHFKLPDDPRRLRVLIGDGAQYMLEDGETYASMAKLFSIRTVKLVSDNMLEIFGGIGYFEDCEYGPIERLYRDCRAMWLEEGPPTVQRITAARGLIETGGYTF